MSHGKTLGLDTENSLKQIQSSGFTSLSYRAELLLLQHLKHLDYIFKNLPKRERQ